MVHKGIAESKESQVEVPSGSGVHSSPSTKEDNILKVSEIRNVKEPKVVPGVLKDDLDVRTRLHMVATYSRSAPNFKSKDGADGIRRWIAATEDFCTSLRMPYSILMENVVLKFEDSEQAKIRAKLVKFNTWTTFKAQLLEMYSDGLQHFKLEQALLSVTRGPGE
jgi:hypothetical protein